MAYSNFDKKGRHRKSRRKIKYEVGMLRQNENAIIEAEDRKNGVNARDRSPNRAGYTVRDKTAS